jgi:hypothetical protein
MLFQETIETTARDMVSAALKHEFPDFEIAVLTRYNLGRKCLEIEAKLLVHDQAQASERALTIVDDIQEVELHRASPVQLVSRLLLRMIDQVYMATGRRRKHEPTRQREAEPGPGLRDQGPALTGG